MSIHVILIFMYIIYVYIMYKYMLKLEQEAVAARLEEGLSTLHPTPCTQTQHSLPWCVCIYMYIYIYIYICIYIYIYTPW